MKTGIAKLREDGLNGLLVRRGLDPSVRIPKHLADDTLLAYAAPRENRPELPRIGEGGIGQARDLPGSLERQVEFLRPRAIRVGTVHDDCLFAARPPDRVEAFEAEADRVHQAMAAGTDLIRDVLAQSLTP